MIHDHTVTIFDKNRSNQIHYLACGNDQVTNPGAWDVPVPVVDGAEQVSPYVNMADGGNTIFASGGGRIYRVTQATQTRAKLWRTEDVKLAAPPALKSLSFKSYTTTLHVSDPNNLPVANSQLEISTDSRTPVYINGVYYVLGVEPAKIKTDATGVATVIQETQNINCAVLKVEAGAGATQAVINPMMKSFEKLGQLDSASSLRHASFPTNTIAGGMRGSPQFSPLVESSVTEADVNAVAEGMKRFITAYSHIQTPDLRSRELFNLHFAVIPSKLGHGLEITGSMIALGDLFLLLRSATDATANVVWNAASDAWHFIVQIAEQVYHAVLDTVDAIVGAIEWIFNAVKTAITKIIRYVEFLFEWDDIRRTKDVMYNITKLFFQHQIDGISEEKKDFETMLTSAEQSLGEFAGFSDWSNLGDAANQPASANVKNPATGQTSGSQMLGNHYRTHAGNLRIVQYPVPSSKIDKDSVQRSLDGVMEALAQKQGDNSTFAKQLGDVAKEFDLMEIKAALEKLAVIIVDGILSSARVVVDTLLDLLKELATVGFDALDAKLHIPIISDILNEIGIEDVSLLDLSTWISATSFTVVYKIVNNTAPFLDNEDVQALITAKSWDELTPLFHTPSSMTTDLTVPILREPGTDPALARHSIMNHLIFMAGHGMAAAVGAYVVEINALEANCPTGDNPFSTPSAICGIVAAACQAAADSFAPRCPLQNDCMRDLSWVTTTLVILSKAIFSSIGQACLASKGLPTAADARAMGTGINSLLVAPGLAVTIYHFIELTKQPSSNDRLAAFVGEVSNLSSYLARICYGLALIDEDPETREFFIGVMTAANLTTAGSQLLEAGADA